METTRSVVSSTGAWPWCPGSTNAIPQSPHFISKADSLPQSLWKIINCGYNLIPVMYKLLSTLAKLPVTVEHRDTRQTQGSRHTMVSAYQQPASCTLPSNGASHTPHLPNTIPHEAGSCDISSVVAILI